MTTPLTRAEFTHLKFGLPSAIPQSMLDGHLAAAASSLNFMMPDEVLRWVSETTGGGGLPDSKIVISDQVRNDLIIRHYQAVNDALNDQTYVPNLADPHAWRRGYMAGVNADMIAWAQLTAAKPDLLKVIMSGECAGLSDAAQRIHAFWIARRHQDFGIGSIREQLAAMSPQASTLPLRTSSVRR